MVLEYLQSHQEELYGMNVKTMEIQLIPTLASVGNRKRMSHNSHLNVGPFSIIIK